MPVRRGRHRQRGALVSFEHVLLAQPKHRAQTDPSAKIEDALRIHEVGDNVTAQMDVARNGDAGTTDH